MEKKLVEPEYYKDRDLFYLYEIVYLWFDQSPDREDLNNAPNPSVIELVEDIIKNLTPLNKENDLIIQHSQSFIQRTQWHPGDLVVIPSIGSYCFEPDVLPNIGDWVPPEQQNPNQLSQDTQTVTKEKAECWQEFIYTRNDLITLAKQRNQKPQILFPDASIDFKNWRSLKESYLCNDENKKQSAYNKMFFSESELQLEHFKKMNEHRIKNAVSPPAQTSEKTKVKKSNKNKKLGLMNIKRLESLKGFVQLLEHAAKEEGIAFKPDEMKCSKEMLLDELKEYEKKINVPKQNRVWEPLKDMDKKLWSSPERLVICDTIKHGKKPDPFFFKKLRINKELKTN